MFTATDEKMPQTDQLMECLIERTNHKCKRCTRFFSNEAALKQHHCEPSIKKEKCPNCSKTINRTNNLEKHLRSYEKAPTHPAKPQLCQRTLDEPTSAENEHSTSKKLVVEEVHDLKYTTLTFRKAFNTHYKTEVLQRLKEIIHSMTPVIEGQARANAEAVKWLVSIIKDELLQVHKP